MNTNSRYTQVVVLALIQKKNSFLFTLRHDPGSDFHGKWQIPGGGLEFSETPEAALHREVREELGVEVTITRLVPFVDTKIRGNWQGIFITYLCVLEEENMEIILNEEASEYRWMTADEVEEVPVLAGCREMLMRVSNDE